MKKIIHLLSGVVISLNALGQVCSTPVSSGAGAPALGPCSDLVDYISSSNITIPINFIFFKPLTGAGKFDTITQASCIDIVNFMNSKWSNLLPPTKPLPAPYTAPLGYTDSKVRFSFKSISFKHDAQYGVNGPPLTSPYPAYTVTDSAALNIVFNVNTAGPAGRSFGIGSNLLTCLEGPSSTDFGFFNGGARHLFFLHEVGHAIGLEHTFFDPWNKPMSIFSNPAGTILMPPPVNDVWFEDSAVVASQIPNNYMGYSWPARDYLSPKQIGQIHYTLKYNPVVRKMANLNALSDCQVGSDWVMYSNTYPGTLFADADLIIAQGNHVIITGCVYMKAGTRIIVEPGAKLSLINGNIKSACGTPWKGIELQSNPGGIQSINPTTQMPNSSVGMLVLNDAVIEDAEIAVNVGKYNSTGTYFVAGGLTFPGSWIPYSGAGIVFSENTQFLNNRISVNFNPYFVWTAGGADNLSYFKKNTFRVDSNYLNPGDPFAAININTTFSVDILGCNFKDVVKMTSIGVRCFNGSFNIKDHCSSVSGPNCNGTLTKTSINGFKYGVFINNWIMNVPSVIRNAKIDQRTSIMGKPYPSGCLGGIYLSGTYGTEIVDCEFENVKLPGTQGPLTFGVYLDGCDGYVVENNSFKGINAYLSGGLFVNNSGPGANSIYNNTFFNHQQGLWTQNINYDASSTNGTGLLMNCNDFLSPVKYNIGVQTLYTGPNCAGCPPIYQPGGVATTQGVTSLLETDNVRNTYNTPNCNDENKFYISTPNGFVVTSHGSFQGNQYHPTPQPNCSSNNELTDIVGLITLNPRTSWCPSNYYQSFGKAMLMANISRTRADIATLKTQLTSKLDGGNTVILLNLLASSAPISEKFETLLSKEFLSDEVLQAFFTLNGIAPVQVEQLFTKNAPVQPAIWATIGTLGLSSTLYSALSNLQFNQNKLSAREVIQSQLTLAKNQFGLFNNENIRRFLKEGNANIAYDSIAAIYDRNELPNSAFKCVDLAIATNHFTEAENRINALRTNSANEDICNVFDYILDLKQDVAYAETMRANTSIKTYLKSKTGSNKPLLSTYAKTLLEGIYFDREKEVTLQPDGFVPESERRANWETEANATIIETLNDKTIRVYPNPASDKLFVENEYEEEPIHLEIVNLEGKTLITQACEKKCAIGLADLKNGIYLLNLYQANKLLSTKKLVIIK